MSQNSDDPMTLTSVLTEAEASALVLALQDYGIEAQTMGGFRVAYWTAPTIEIQVLVKSVDLDRAQTALEEIRLGDSDVDWSQIDVGEPEE